MRCGVTQLSPPCQPYTRQGLQRGSEDPRAESFILLLEKLALMAHKPTHVLVENVVGFEASETRRLLVETLRGNGYATQEMIASPLDVGVPYSRARYFCLAKLQPARFANEEWNSHILETLPPEMGGRIGPSRDQRGATTAATAAAHADGDNGGGDGGGRVLDEFLAEELKFRRKRKAATEADPDSCKPEGPGRLEGYLLKRSVRDKYLHVFDIVTPYSKSCCCFTKDKISLWRSSLHSSK